VNAGEAFVVQSNVSVEATALKSLILAAYTPGEAILSEVSLAGDTVVPTTLVIPPIQKSTKLLLFLAVFQNSSGTWVQVSNVYSTTLTVTDLVTLTVQTSIPGVSFSFDGTQYVTNSSGGVNVQTVAGLHLVQAELFIYLTNVSRLRFLGWEDSTNETSRQISLNGNETIEISYAQQYLLQVNSTYGQTVGSGWYDANSTASILVQPVMLNSPPVMFSHWSPYENQTQMGFLFTVASPQAISAVWDTANIAPIAGLNLLDPTLILSTLAFIVLVGLNIKFRSSKQVSNGPP
jgi:hypothetical protein